MVAASFFFSTADLDFATTTRVLAFFPSLEVCAEIPIIDDDVLENDEVFIVELSTDDPNIQLGTESVSVTITNTDSMYSYCY